MQRLSTEELLAFVGLPIAVLATIAAIAAVSHKQTRTLLMAGLGVWVVLTSVLLGLRYHATGAPDVPLERAYQPENHSTPQVARDERPLNAQPDRSPDEQPRSERRDEVDVAASVPLSAVEKHPPLPPRPSPRPSADEVRGRLLGSWTGTVPNTGQPPTTVIIDFLADGRLVEHFSSARAYIRGKLASDRRFRTDVRFEVASADSIILRYRVFGMPISEPTGLRFTGGDTLEWTRKFIQSSPVGATLTRVRSP
jgi:hypothetical protein